MSQTIQINTQFLIPIKPFFCFDSQNVWTVAPTEAVERPSNTGWRENVI